jgi:hypothetical protein
LDKVQVDLILLRGGRLLASRKSENKSWVKLTLSPFE